MVQMPALNTPQFGWVKSRLSRQSAAGAADFPAGSRGGSDLLRCAQSAARILYRPADSESHRCRQNCPGLLDRYLARTGYDSQQYDGAEDPNRPDNLWHPVPGDHGAHGAFDARARVWSPQLWAQRTPRVGCARHGALVTYGRSRASRKQMITSLQRGIAQTHRCASRDRVNPQASRFASQWRCRPQLRLQNATRRGPVLGLKYQIQLQPVNR